MMQWGTNCVKINLFSKNATIPPSQPVLALVLSTRIALILFLPLNSCKTSTTCSAWTVPVAPILGRTLCVRYLLSYGVSFVKVKWHSGPLVFLLFSVHFPPQISLYSKVSLFILPSTAIHIRFSILSPCFCWAVIFTLVFALSTLHLSKIISIILILGIRKPIAFKSKSKALERLPQKLGVLVV